MSRILYVGLAIKQIKILPGLSIVFNFKTSLTVNFDVKVFILLFLVYIESHVEVYSVTKI